MRLSILALLAFMMVACSPIYGHDATPVTEPGDSEEEGYQTKQQFFNDAPPECVVLDRYYMEDSFSTRWEDSAGLYCRVEQ